MTSAGDDGDPDDDQGKTTNSFLTSADGSDRCPAGKTGPYPILNTRFDDTTMIIADKTRYIGTKGTGERIAYMPLVVLLDFLLASPLD